MNGHRRRAYAAADALAAALRTHPAAGAVISPGSRSTPLALAAASWGPPWRVVLDERSAGFAALGMAKASGKPAALICTSGTAAANYLPAVAEADRARTPLVVITADRPPGFLERDAPQTIDQVGLFGRRVRAAACLPVAHECDPRRAAEEMHRLLRAAAPPDAGPVHMNIPFAKPLEPPRRRPPPIEAPAPEAATPPAAVDTRSAERLQRFMERAERGAVLAGPRSADPAEGEAVYRLGEAGWPILADPLSGLRVFDRPNLITAGDLLLRNAGFAAEHKPDSLIRIGGTPTGSATQAWLEKPAVPCAFLDPDFRWTAPGPELVLRDPIAPLLEAVTPPPLDPGWGESWQAAEERMSRRRRIERSEHPGTEPAATAAVLESEPVVWVGSSLPVRHADAMMEAGCPAVVLGNRGACGIDGAVASAAGAALALGRRVTALIGDLTFLHDAGSLAAARRLEVDLTIAVLDNGGGAIFEALPYLRFLREEGNSEAYAEGRELFVAPHGQDLAAVAAGFGVWTERVDPSRIAESLAGARSRPGVNVLVVETDPADAFAAYDRLVRK